MKKLIPLVLLLLIGAGLVYNYSGWFAADSEAGLVLYGNVDIREVQPAFRVPGRLQRMHFEEGDRVSAGDLLAELDPLALSIAAVISRLKSVYSSRHLTINCCD